MCLLIVYHTIITYFYSKPNSELVVIIQSKYNCAISYIIWDIQFKTIFIPYVKQYT